MYQHPRRTPGPVHVVIAVIAALLVPVGWAGVAAAAPLAPVPAVASVTEGPDYFTESAADPLDMNNVEDFDPSPAEGTNDSVAGPGLHNTTRNGGIAAMTAEPGGYYIMAESIGGALHISPRDTALHPINTAQYTHVQMRIYSDTPTTMSSAFMWFNCNVQQNCTGAKVFALKVGWHTYDIDLSNPADVITATKWTGTANQLRFYPQLGSGPTMHVELDWMRLAGGPSSNVNVTIPGGAQQVTWSAPGQSHVFATNVAPGGVAVFPASALPPGTYNISYTNASGTSPSAPVTVGARPVPVVIDPDVTGGDDYATFMRGNPWDFNEVSDLSNCVNCTFAVGGGVVNGSTAGPVTFDPNLELAVPTLIDTVRYHRLSVRASYSGRWGLSGNPGGGMVGRFVWKIPMGGSEYAWQESNDIVVYPGGYRTYSVDLRTNPPHAINDEFTPDPLGWGAPASSVVSGVRWDPHEDPGSRNWSVDYVTLAANDQGKPHFPIRFEDRAWKPGTTADIYVDTDAGGYNGIQIAGGVSVGPGVNTFNWNGTNVLNQPIGTGSFHVYIQLRDPANVTARAYSTGPVDMPTQPANPPAPPVNPSAVAGTESATVSWSPPTGSNGGATITNYVVRVQPGGGQISVPFGQNSTVVTGLPGGVPHTFSVAAQNSAGIGMFAGPTAAVTPTALPGTRFHPVVPYRVLDSRTTTGQWNNNPLDGGEIGGLTVAGTGGAGGVPANASAVVLNVTATAGTQGSFATVYPFGAVRPTPSNLNFAAGQTIPNLVTAKIGSNGKVAIFNAAGSAHFIADVVGYYDDGTGGTGDLYRGMPPQRLLDSRDQAGPWRSKLGAGTANQRDLVVRGTGTGVPLTATAVIMNVTSTNATQNSFMRVWPRGATAPDNSNLNFATNQTIPNLVVVQVGTNDSVSFFNAAGQTDVVADVLGYYDPAAGGSFFHSMAPVRILDNRLGVGGYPTSWGPGTSRDVQVASTPGIPASATGVVMNTTVTAPTGGSFLKVFPDGVVPDPITTNLNFGPGQTIPNLVITPLPANGKVRITNLAGSVDVIGDVAGYFAAT